MEGTVIKSTGSWYYVRDEQGSIWACKIKGTFRIKGIRTTNPVAVGDVVDFNKVPEGEREGLITRLHPRRNYIIRRATNLSRESHIIASNIDQAVIMATLAYPQTYTLFIDRFLVTAEAYRIPAKILFNKIDLYDEKLNQQLDHLTDLYEHAGYTCLKLSLTREKNLEAVKDLLKDQTSVIAGNSGVGKSTLINRLNPEAELRTAEISNYHKAGKHCTTFAEMIDLPFGGHIIDTPGIKGFGLIDFYKEEIYHYFPEIFKASQECKFHNCTHTHEPGCNVKESVKNGTISETRYNNYIRILEDNEEKFR
ncbi:MAG: ribosome small subunit-dependent GTPase A [Bacteroidales bacterium]|nr:ribosome small subunit-dependent GTPase A [Bacteroidales bacterium]